MDRKVALDDVQRKLDILQEGGHAESLRLYRGHRRIDGMWKAVLAASEGGLEAVSEAVGAMAVSDLNLSTNDDEAAPALRRTHRSLHQLIEGFRSEVLGSIEEVRRQLADVLRSADASEWADAVHASEEAYRSTVSQLEEEGIADPEEYGELVEQARRLEAEIEKLRTEEQSARELEKEAATVLAKYREARNQLSDKRQNFARRASGDTLEVKVDKFAGHSNLAENLADTLGIITFIEDRKVIADRITPQEDTEWDWRSLDSVIGEIRAFQMGEDESWATRDARFATRLRNLPAERVDRLALYLPEDVLEVSFRSGNSAPWRPIAQGSPGQTDCGSLGVRAGFWFGTDRVGPAGGRLGQHANI